MESTGGSPVQRGLVSRKWWCCHRMYGFEWLFGIRQLLKIDMFIKVCLEGGK